MEGVSLGAFLQIAKELGPFAVLLLIWWVDAKNTRRILAAYREDVAGIRQLYENNVDLVRSYDRHVGQQERLMVEVLGVVSLNSQAVTKLESAIQHNDACPLLRGEKEPK